MKCFFPTQLARRLSQLHSTHVFDRVTAQLLYCHHHHLIMEHLVQGKEWTVLSEDKVVVPPPVVPAVSQLQHVQYA